MKRARLDGANDAFFKGLEPAKMNDFFPAITIIIVGAMVGGYLATANNSGWLALIALVGAGGVMVYQFVSVATFWERSLSDDWAQKN